MKRTFCDGCGKNLDGQKIKAMQIEHTFDNGATFRADITKFGTSLNNPSKTILFGDGDLCEECALTVIQEGFPV